MERAAPSFLPYAKAGCHGGVTPSVGCERFCPPRYERAQAQLLHGIRRSSCWPVVSPLAFARLTSPLPFPILKQPCGYGDLLPSGDDYDEGDLLPNSGVDDEGILLPQSGDANEAGDLLPYSGDEDGEGDPPSQGIDQADLCDLKSPINYTLGNTLGIDLPVDSEHAMIEADAVIMISLPVAGTYVFDPGGLLFLLAIFLSAYILVHAHIQFGQKKVLQDVAATTLLIKQHADTLPTPSSIIFILFNAMPHAKLPDPSVALTPLRGSSHEKDVVALYDCSLWLNSSKDKVGAEAHFLIPLRGRRCDQWNDEVEDEDVAALKTKIWMKMQMRLLYITKDLLDPG